MLRMVVSLSSSAESCSLPSSSTLTMTSRPVVSGTGCVAGSVLVGAVCVIDAGAWGVWLFYHHGGISHHCHCQGFVGMGVIWEQWKSIINIAMWPQAPRVDPAVLEYATMVMPHYNITGFLNKLVDGSFPCPKLSCIVPNGACLRWVSADCGHHNTRTTGYWCS